MILSLCPMKKWIVSLLIIISLSFISAQALEERHLMVMCYEKADNESQMNDIVKLLITYGFDNRSIVGVYVSPSSDGTQMAQLLSKIGLFTADKIHTDKRLLKAKPALMDVYHEVEALYPKGHVIFMMTAKPATAIIQMLTQDEETRLKPGQGYLVPLFKRKEVA